jgi:MFS family permease
MGEGGGFPAATKAVAEWFPASERSLAMGIMNAGTALGAVIAPPFIAAVLSLATLRVLGLRAQVIDVFHGETELILMMLALAAVFGSAIGQNA